MPLPVEIRCFDRWMTVRLPAPYRCTGWAIAGGGETVTDTVAWRFLAIDEIKDCADPKAWLVDLMAGAGLAGAVGLLTSRALHRYVESGAGGDCHVVATVGLSNALAAGDPPVAARAGTINILCVVAEPLSAEAALEALALASEAKAAAVLENGVTSVVTGRAASGTGTDCIVVAHPVGAGGAAYCGKHTELGHRIGTHVRQAVSQGIREWLAEFGPRAARTRNTKAKALFVGGTASHAGKSWMTTAICRHLRNRGMRVAPFKAQNMSNNSFACAGGFEIGRAQVAQAEACNLDPEPDMNPVLLKPVSSAGSQVVVNGRVWRNLGASDYYGHTAALTQAAHDAYDRLAQRFECIVIEGAGSIAEMNLKNRDFVNLSMAEYAGARALLVADIDRGGVFASVIGTLALLDEAERSMVRAFAVNRFRGDRTLFQDGVRMIEQRAGCPSLGVFPMLEGVQLDEEDSVSLEGRRWEGEADIAILHLPRISNFTDFRQLRAAWISHPVERFYPWIVLPGTKNTIGDLRWMRETGLADWVLRQYERGAKVLGVCGGYQMLGRAIHDPDGVEHDTGRTAEGLGLLAVETTLAPEKTVRAVRAVWNGVEAGGYEIHAGHTTSALPPFAVLEDGAPDGAMRGRVMGTYLHGVLEHRGIAGQLFGEASLVPPQARPYDALARWFEEHADLRLFEEQFL